MYLQQLLKRFVSLTIKHLKHFLYHYYYDKILPSFKIISLTQFPWFYFVKMSLVG